MEPLIRPPRPVVDPALPERVSALLRADPRVLRASRRPGPVPSRAAPDPFAVFASAAFLLLAWAVAGLSGLLSAAVMAGVFAAGCALTVGSGSRRERRRWRAAREHADRFVVPEDLDDECGALLRRAQDAAEAVLGSHVNRDGLLDAIDNAVTLPEQVWRIATRLVRLSQMRAEHRRIVPGAPPPEVAQAFAPYGEALETALAALVERVEALEEYAAQVRRADAVYRSYRQLEALAERAPRYEELVAEIAGDGAALPPLERLTDQARQVREAFLADMERARRAGGNLIGTERP
ncbi:hypothetical protein GCM10010466_32290 [Planomonospora alba]|uniref:5-bromo-4-chloroindolyl phosphate hydrolysis protein n=1 Tax=Planomonospora alba TaxID=161354 RepID=A0ABP6N7N5_9ACTN